MKTTTNLIFIQGNIPSLKNSKQWIPPRISKYGKKIPGRLISSKTVMKYLKTYEQLWTYNRTKFLTILKKKKVTPPYHIGFHFVRDSRRRYDFINAVQICQDLMVKHGWIEDDNVEFIFPHPLDIGGKFTSYNKEEPGVYIKVMDIDLKNLLNSLSQETETPYRDKTTGLDLLVANAVELETLAN